MLYPASDIDWQFNSYMIVYMLECHSPKSSHPLLLPLSPKVRYTHWNLCLNDYPKSTVTQVTLRNALRNRTLAMMSFSPLKMNRVVVGGGVWTGHGDSRDDQVGDYFYSCGFPLLISCLSTPPSTSPKSQNLKKVLGVMPPWLLNFHMLLWGDKNLFFS